MRVLRSFSTIVAAGLCSIGFAATPALAAHRPVTPARHSPGPLIYVGAQKMRVPAIVLGGRVFVPVRGVFEAIHASVEYAPPHFVVVRKDGAVIAGFILDRPHAIVGQRAHELDVAPMRRDGRIYVPLRIVAEAAGATVAFSSRPPIVHIWQPAPALAAMPAGADGPASPAPADEAAAGAGGTSVLLWTVGVAVVAGLGLLGFVVVAARRYAPRAASTPLAMPRRPARAVAPDVGAEVLPDNVAVSTVAASGEARFRRELITEKRTIEVPVTREELVIEYAGEGGIVLIEGRALAPGEIIRIPLWEERVDIDITQHQILTNDIVIEKRRTAGPLSVKDRMHPAEVGLIEPSPG